MSNKAIIEKTIEALEARGFSNAEAVQMVRRIQSGNAENLPQVETISTEQFNKIYQDGYKAGHADGVSYAGNLNIKSAAEKQMRDYTDAMRNQAAQSGLYNPYRGGIQLFRKHV